MELRHLRYFVAVAEELHFTRAAIRLGIGQPPLSQQIKSLEAEIGTPLFHRLPRQVELTDAGSLFLAEARLILAHADRAVAIAQKAGRGEVGSVRLGCSSSATYHPYVGTTIKSFRQAFPDVALTLVESSTAELVRDLREGRVDAGFVRPPIIEGDGIAVLALPDEGMSIVLPSDHPLAGGGPVRLGALDGERLILFPRSLGPGFFDAIIAACQAAGFSPNISQETGQMGSILHLVAAGIGISVLPESLCHIHADGVRYLPIAGGGPRARLSLAYRKGERSTAVRNFLARARQNAKPADP